MKTNNKGITLIALVVTIIVLLILAGITLSLALNNNGIIGRSKNATATYKEAELQEKSILDQMEEQIKNEEKKEYIKIKTQEKTVSYNDETMKVIEFDISLDDKMSYHEWVQNYLKDKEEPELESILATCYGKEKVEEVFAMFRMGSTKEEFIEKIPAYGLGETYKDGLKGLIEMVSSNITYIHASYVAYDSGIDQLSDEELDELFYELTETRWEDIDEDEDMQRSYNSAKEMGYTKTTFIAAQYLAKKNNFDKYAVNTKQDEGIAKITILKDNEVKVEEKVGKFQLNFQIPATENGIYTIRVESNGETKEETITITDAE